MKFSICIPNYNYEEFLGRTLQSALAQTHDDFEVVVVDNASTDSSVQVVESFQSPRIQLYQNRTNVGFAGNLDRVASRATGESLILLSSDDLIRSHALEVYGKLLSELGTDAERSTISSLVEVIDARDNVIGTQDLDRKLWTRAKVHRGLSSAVGFTVYEIESRHLLQRSLQLLRTPFAFLSTCYPKAAYDAVGGYGGGRLINPDKWFAWKLLGHTERSYYVDAPLFAYRVHGGGQGAIQARTGALKHLVDDYVSTFEAPTPLLERAGVSRTDLERAFIEQDIALRGLVALAQGDRRLAARGLSFGRAAYPEHSRSNRKIWLLRALLELGPLGTRVASIARGPVQAAWTRSQGRKA